MVSMAIKRQRTISLTQTAEGAMSEVTEMLQRMRELSLQSVNGVNNDSDRASLDAEVQALIAELIGSLTRQPSTIKRYLMGHTIVPSRLATTHPRPLTWL